MKCNTKFAKYASKELLDTLESFEPLQNKQNSNKLSKRIINLILLIMWRPSFIAVVLVVLGFHPGTFGHLIRVSSNIEFSGTTQEINLGNSCFNLAHPINDDISSVDPNGKCVRLYTNERCRGPYIEAEEIISDLTSRGVNDAISSIKLCHTLSMSSRSSFPHHHIQNKVDDVILMDQPDDLNYEDDLMNIKYDVRGG